MYYENRAYELSIIDHTSGAYTLQCPVHMHYHVEIVYMKEGESTAVVDGNEYSLRPDSLLIVFPNSPHTYISRGVEKYMLSIISPNIQPEVVRLFDIYTPESPMLKDVSKHQDLKFVLDSLLAMSNEGKEPSGRRNNIVRLGYATALFGLIFKYLPTVKKGNECSRSMRAVTDYCVRNYNKELSLAILSEELHMSKYYISHLFGKEFGMKFNDYINSLRVSAASRLLCDTAKSITEISEEVGFATARTFNRAFSKQYKISPTEYRASSKLRNE